MRIAIGNGIATGRHAIGLGCNTDARTCEEDGSRDIGLDELVYDPNTATFVQNDVQNSFHQSSSFEHTFSPPPSETLNSDVPLATKKRNRSEVEGKDTTSEPNNIQSDIIHKLTNSVDKLAEVISSFDNSEYSCWDLIKDIPNLDKRARYKALRLLNTRAKKIEFVKMTPEERFEWITFELEQ